MRHHFSALWIENLSLEGRLHWVWSGMWKLEFSFSIDNRWKMRSIIFFKKIGNLTKVFVNFWSHFILIIFSSSTSNLTSKSHPLNHSHTVNSVVNSTSIDFENKFHIIIEHLECWNVLFLIWIMWQLNDVWNVIWSPYTSGANRVAKEWTRDRYKSGKTNESFHINFSLSDWQYFSYTIDWSDSPALCDIEKPNVRGRKMFVKIYLFSPT